MARKPYKHKIDVLVEGPDGELVFKTVEVTKNDIRALLDTKHSFLKHNLEKELKEKKIRV